MFDFRLHQALRQGLRDLGWVEGTPRASDEQIDACRVAAWAGEAATGRRRSG